MANDRAREVQGLKADDRITDGKRTGAVEMVYPGGKDAGAYVRWDGAKRQSYIRAASLAKFTKIS
jgi:hypothetical protein